MSQYSAFADRAARHPRRDYIRHVGSLLGVNGHQVIDRRIGCHHDRISGDDVASDLDLGGRTAVDLIGMGLGK